jgi:hypothetical protein
MRGFREAGFFLRFYTDLTIPVGKFDIRIVG